MEEDDIKIALRNLAQDNLTLCNELLNIQANPQIIAEQLLGCSDDDIERFIDARRINNERLRLGIEQLKKFDLDMTYNCNIYFFSPIRGLITTSPRKLLDFDYLYDGEDIAVDIEQIIPELLSPLLHNALKNSGMTLCRRINESIAEVLTLLDIQKDEGNE